MASPDHAAPALPPFATLFGRSPAVTARAPGRVNLIGEHTDYSEGFVFPAAIPRDTVVEIAPRADRRVRAASANAGGGAIAEFELGHEKKQNVWFDYLMGVTSVLAKAGYALSGFDVRISSTVPLGAGLSSSASFEVAMLRGLRQAFGLEVDDVRIAQLGQLTETDFVGAPVGIMDQMAASLADKGSALFLDTRTLAYERVPLPASADLVILNSGVTHSHAGGEYRTRRAECEQAAASLGVRVLRDLTLQDLPRIEALPDPVRKRARHVVTENNRVQATVDALRAGDLERVGKLLYAGHASLRDDFQVSVREIDLIVTIAQETPGVHGARLTGGGFGGSVVILADVARAPAVATEVAARYAKESGRTPTTLRLKE